MSKILKIIQNAKNLGGAKTKGAQNGSYARKLEGRENLSNGRACRYQRSAGKILSLISSNIRSF